MEKYCSYNKILRTDERVVLINFLMKDTEFINSNRHNTREEEQNYHYYRKI